ncbi:MAG: hypothetical protein NVV60_01530 [Luteimonas sp.]|nr:hypothetical protein [Luteimonas sp.]
MAEQQDLMPDAPIDAEGLLGADLDGVPQEKWAKGLVDLIAVQEAAFKRHGLDDTEAFRLARVGIIAQAEFGGGRQWYLPRGDDLLIALRDAEIFRRARRGNIPELAQEFDLTERSVWRIVRLQHKLHLGKVQGRLFDEQGEP